MDIDKIARAWRMSSRKDLEVARSLFEKKYFAHCLFFCHLAVEKELKRIYLIRSGEMPPFSHNLVRIVDACDLQLDDSIRKELQELTTFNIKARYEIVKAQFQRKATKSYTEKWLNRTEQVLALLKKTR